ncbi:type II toxin-antitoxin system VapC family toxin [Acidithiobacillus ferriphilus]|uniref:type II toxin-antitoxin system VapC family toxin n=1 Tax=Acidithiobacillus ferriphilus TaxID=1689834 RepID=UPI00232D037F|nr:type II toxin-antitoxin system VapC family toxin [Acidithiobacillus ferriphilus]WCE93169.1 type II toxin-antitoxin system VapC family toxin [Acidithiobacillus ferriphilus]
MRYLLDTCVLSELVKKHPDPRVVTWVDAREAVGFLSVLTLGELQKGVAKLVDGDKRSMLQDWIDVDLRGRFVGRILPVNEHIASAWGGITGAAEQRGEKLPAIDSLLAATALVHHLTVATRNIVDLQRCQVPVVDPWDQT